MHLKLKNSKNTLPSGMPFVDPRTGRSFDAYQMGLNETIRGIINHRSKNPTFYPESEGRWFDPIMVRQEVLRVAYEKRPDLFKQLDGEPIIQVAPVVNSKDPVCNNCGSLSLEPIYCPTCSGKRITGYKCNNCGKASRK